MNIEQPEVPTIKREETLDGETVDSVVINSPETLAIDGVDAKEIAAEKDKENLVQIRETLGILAEEEIDERKGWRAILKPRNEYREERKLTVDSPFGRLKDWINSFSKNKRDEKRINLEAQEQLINARGKLPEVEFTYKPGTGVEGRVGDGVGILAKGFHECSGVIFQTPDGVSIIHISPNSINDGGEIVNDSDYIGHIRSALKKLISQTGMVEKTDRADRLSKKEITKLQKMVDIGELRATMLLGEDRISPVIPMELASGRNPDLPAVKTEAYYTVGAGGGGYAIYASPTEIYFIGSDSAVMKKGSNFPPKMFDYKEV